MIKQICPQCGKDFESERWKHQKFCSVKCGVSSHKGITYETKRCAFCQKEFKSEGWKHRKYCSTKCAYLAQQGITYEDRKCLSCGEIFRIQPFKPNKYCSRKCMGLAYRVARKTKRISSPQNGKGQYKHRLMMEEHIDRKLLPNERVHHIDLDKQSNLEDCSNFYLYLNESEHQKGHRSLDRLVKPLLEQGIISFNKGKYFLSKEKS